MDNEKVNINDYFVEFMKKNKIKFFIYLSLLIVYPLQRIILPKYYGIIISTLNKGKRNTFLNNVKIFLLIYIVIQILFTFDHYLQGSLIPKFSEYSVQQIFSNIVQNKKLNYDNLEVGEILSKIIKVPSIIYSYLDLLRWVIFGQAAILIAAIIHYKNVSNKVFYTFLFLVFAFILLQCINFYGTLGIEINREKEKDKVYQHFQDLLNNLISVVVCKQESSEKKHLHIKFQPYIKAFIASININVIYRSIFGIFNVISFILMNYLLYKEYELNHISKETFLSSFIITYSILQLFSNANHLLRTMVDTYSQVKDMEHYFNEKTDFEENTQKHPEDKKFSKGQISFQNIIYQYKENAEFKDKYAYAVKNINIDIRENEHVAIIGQIGSGKSTLVKLLMKFFEPTEGDIFINNINLKHISRNELYDHIFYIPQKPHLLNRTLYENIYYGIEEEKGDKEKNIEKIKHIMEEMNIEQNIIDIFMEKMDQPLGNDGVKLSGGQRQIVWIIRAMLRNTAIIVFDEPTSALDKQNKAKIMKVIKDIGKNKTIIIISHDEIDSSFRKIHLKQGEVIEQHDKQFFGWM